ncbi:MAG: glycosyltransferase family 4 protein [Chloroflexi bacterium]|nr:glycosyltransferase family 4 protein [Chloroflexota bacterium]
MKIALVSPYDFAFPGGVTVHITHLARQFIRLGHSVKILAPSSQPPSQEHRDLFVWLGRPVSIASGGSTARITLSLWLFPKVRALLRQEQFDIIHLHEPLTPALPYFVLKCSPSVNVATFHAYHERPKLYPFARYLSRGSMEKLHGRIAVSRPAMEMVSHYFPGEYRIIPNGIDVDHFTHRLPPLSQFADGKVNLLFVGRLEKRKGLKYLLGAYSRLKWDYPNLRLIVVGPGEPDKDSYRLMGERNLHDVVFTGMVRYEELPRYYQTADIFCAPATGKESFGIVLLEAMASGTPVVASAIEGYSNLVTSEEALLVKPKDEEALALGIRLLLEAPALRRQMVAAGLRRVEEYRWERVAAQVLDYYQETLESQSGIKALTASGAARS